MCALRIRALAASAAGLCLIAPPVAPAQTPGCKLTLCGGATVDELGDVVAIDGETVLVGNDKDDEIGASAGAAHLFDARTGQELFKLLAADAAVADQFGCEVAIDAGTAIVGSPGDDDNGSLSGAAYVFNAFTGAELFKLTPADGAAEDRFGQSVAVSGDLAVIGAKDDDDNGASSGAAYVFDVNTGAELFKLTPADGAAGDIFGTSVALSGDTALIGASLDNSGGSAYVFDASTGAELSKLLPADGAGGRFGDAVAISAGTGVAERNDNDLVFGELEIGDDPVAFNLGRLVLSGGSAQAGDAGMERDGAGVAVWQINPPGNYIINAGVTTSLAEETNHCLADLNGDNIADTSDLGIMIAQFGQPCPCTADLNGDGVVDTADLGIMVGVFGELCDGCVGAPSGSPESLMAGRGTKQPTPLLDALGFGSVHDYTAWLESLSREEIFDHLDNCMEIIRAAE